MIVFISNFINHHQIGVAEELYTLLNGDYRFLETIPMPDSFKRTGYPNYSYMPFVIRTWEDEVQKKLGGKLILEADVVVFGGWGHFIDLIKKRIQLGRLTFQMSERWLKKGILNLLSPNLIKESLAYWRGGWNNKNIYRLCMSAYAANDLYFLHQYRDRCYKWGYFTSVDKKNDNKNNKKLPYLSIMWCARFIEWKHPEMPVLLAERLKRKGFSVQIDMYGNGKMYSDINKLINKCGVEDVVKLRGNHPNEYILNEMANHEIFLFTSDRNEGWGAVLNEAMSNGTVPVACNQIGSVPFLIEDGINGLIYENNDIDSLEEKIIILLNDPARIKKMSQEAVKTMQNIWSPKIAASRFLKLIEAIKNGEAPQFLNGPCSKALPF